MLVSLIIGFPKVLLVITGPEGVQVIVPLVEVWVCLGAKSHTKLKVGQSLEHLVVSWVNLVGFIMVEDVNKHFIKVVMMLAAANDVVTVIFGMFFRTIENTSSELGSGIFVQDRAIEPIGEVIFYLGHHRLVSLSEQVGEHLK